MKKYIKAENNLNVQKKKIKKMRSNIKKLRYY